MSQIKNLGFLGYSKYDVYDDGRVYSHRSNTFLKGWICKESGYQIMTLHNDNNEPKQLRVHRLVGRAFVEGYREGLIINHKEKPTNNNHYLNLEWTTDKGNLEYAYSKGEHKGKGYKGKLVPFDKVAPKKVGKISDEDVHRVCSLLEEGYRCSDISRLTGIHVRKLNHIRTGDTYTHISSNYEISTGKEARVSEEIVHSICEKLQKGQGVLSISRELCLPRKTVGNIRNRKTFTNISESYKFDKVTRCATTIETTSSDGRE